MNVNKRIIFGLSAVVCLALVAWSSPDENKKAMAAGSITIAELRDHMFFLASDELGGRQPGTQGYRDAAIYGATQFRAAGLKPIVKDEEGNLTFMQPLPMKKTYKSENNKIVVHHGDESATLAHASDYALLSAGKVGNTTVEGLEVVYAGYGISEPDAEWDDYEGLDVKGRVVIIQAGSPMDADGNPVLPEKVHNKYKDAQIGIMPKIMMAMKKEAASILVAPSDISGVGEGMTWDRIISMMARPRISVAEGAFNPLAGIPVPFMLAGSNTINTILAGAPYNPVSGEGEYSTFAVEGVTLDITMEDIDEKFMSHNIVGVVEGTDPELKDEYVTIGAHLDHVGTTNGEVFNGADDNASGSTAVMELAEAIAMNPPRRSVILILYSAEESGLIGSNFFVENCPVPIENVVLNINLDMVGRETEEVPGGVQAIGSSKRSSQLKNIVAEAGDRIDGLNIDFSIDEADPKNFFGRSDQVHYHVKGIPVVFFTTGEHPQYHKPVDDAELIDFAKLQKVAQLSYDVAVTVGNLDDRLVQDAEEK